MAPDFTSVCEQRAAYAFDDGRCFEHSGRRSATVFRETQVWKMGLQIPDLVSAPQAVGLHVGTGQDVSENCISIHR